MTVRTLRTARLELRAPQPKDARVITQALNNYEISKWLTVVPFPYGITDAQWFIGQCRDGTFDAHLIWESDRLVGTIGLTDGLGYWIAKDAWGNGYATEASRAVLSDHFQYTENEIVTSSHFNENQASRRVLEKLGFVDMGPLEHFSKARGCVVPARRMELQRSRWGGA